MNNYKEITISSILEANTNTKETISEEILNSKDAERNYYAAIELGINKIKHLRVVIESKEPLLNYKCIKHCMNTHKLTNEEKKLLIAAHSQVILESKNEEIINKLKHILKYKLTSKQKSRK